jgi:hypothetical protein
MPSSRCRDAERVIRFRILVPAPPVARIGRSMSLYRAGLRLALFLPLGVAMPLLQAAAGFADVSPVVTLPLRAEATIANRTRVRKP